MEDPCQGRENPEGLRPMEDPHHEETPVKTYDPWRTYTQNQKKQGTEEANKKQGVAERSCHLTEGVRRDRVFAGVEGEGC